MSIKPDADGRTALLSAARAELDEHGHAGISLRAVARRAGVSHAAPKYFFQDRAGLLTAIATEGFTALAAALRTVSASRPANPLSALGRAYIDFGLGNRALFDLMFRPTELHTDDPALRTAQEEAIGELGSAVFGRASGSGKGEVPQLSLVSWALAHGLVVLARDGALQSATNAPTPEEAAETARSLAGLFAAHLGADPDTRKTPS
ncbi:TetR/AcrR family transcriptional regulator [Micromonospora sp. NBC_01796]|uniref:TetR/AcrR family transcriptional regulator n=1 Tax=Micromonospora sp. NBC_01796 TaxID=2975987 RepID=UPI002DDA02EF|nr:TetR/AcrR family transcriptional regulator [Micromonospora sp. NBC_01796]WSA83505.1 TetR/AcrR family transcriptional regulator [Micromonospora sp. NBC_01796]